MLESCRTDASSRGGPAYEDNHRVETSGGSEQGAFRRNAVASRKPVGAGRRDT